MLFWCSLKGLDQSLKERIRNEEVRVMWSYRLLALLIKEMSDCLDSSHQLLIFMSQIICLLLFPQASCMSDFQTLKCQCLDYREKDGKTSLLAVFHVFKVCFWWAIEFIPGHSSLFRLSLAEESPSCNWIHVWMMWNEWSALNPDGKLGRSSRMFVLTAAMEIMWHTFLFWLQFQVEKMQSFTYYPEMFF